MRVVSIERVRGAEKSGQMIHREQLKVEPGAGQTLKGGDEEGRRSRKERCHYSIERQ